MEAKSYNITINVLCDDGRVNSLSRTYPADRVASIMHNARCDVEDMAEEGALNIMSMHCHYHDNGIMCSELLFVKRLEFNPETMNYELKP